MAAASNANAENACTVFKVFKTISHSLEELSETNRNSTLQSISENFKFLRKEIIKPMNDRNKFPDNGISVLVKVLEDSSDVNNDVHIQLRAEIFGFLRNLCSLGRHQQLKIADSKLIKISKETVLTALEGNGNCSIRMDGACLTCVVQFWGNLVVNNRDNKKFIWIELKDVIRKLLSVSTDDKLRNYVSMLLYNCLYDEETNIQDLFDDSDLFFFICNFLIQAASEKNVEWGLYTLISLLEKEQFLRKLYQELSNEKKLSLLEVIIEALGDKMMKVHHINIIFLAENLKTHWSEILTVSDADCEQYESLTVLKIMEILCAASARDCYNVELQKDLELLSTLLHLLKSVHQLGKESENNFTPIVKLSAAANPEEVAFNPANGLKVDIVRLIGNLCLKCKRNQDHVRELDCIPILLECCNIDARNPFITQWAIFAIRNMCENNLENQSIIKMMKRLDFDQSSELNRLVENIGKEGSASTSSNSGAPNRNLEDVKALFE